MLLQPMWDFTFHKNRTMSFRPLPWNLHAIELTLCYQSIAFYTLVDIISTQVDLVSWATFSCGVITIIATQGKDDLYHDLFPTNMFVFLTIEIFKCLHQKVTGFFHWCINMAWGAKGTKSLPLLVLCAFCKQIVSMALQHVHVIFILKCVVVVGEGSSKQGVL